MAMIKTTNKITGEVIELPVDTNMDIAGAWRYAQELERAGKSLKDQLKFIVPKIVNEKGLSDQLGSYMFRVSNVQRMNYDKALLRESFDPDLYDVLVIPDKTAIDRYLKEHLEELGDKSTVLRQNMVVQGKPYQVIKLEKIERDKTND